jgi:site-specific DNA-methyltransferase (adenine-specific)
MTVTPYKKTGKISLFLKDCMTGMSDILTKESVDVIVTSPPYKIGINYQRYDDNLPKEKYLQWIENIGSAIKYVLNLLVHSFLT